MCEWGEGHSCTVEAAHCTRTTFHVRKSLYVVVHVREWPGRILSLPKQHTSHGRQINSDQTELMREMKNSSATGTPPPARWTASSIHPETDKEQHHLKGISPASTDRDHARPRGNGWGWLTFQDSRLDWLTDISVLHDWPTNWPSTRPWRLYYMTDLYTWLSLLTWTNDSQTDLQKWFTWLSYRIGLHDWNMNWLTKLMYESTDTIVLQNRHYIIDLLNWHKEMTQHLWLT